MEQQISMQIIIIKNGVWKITWQANSIGNSVHGLVASEQSLVEDSVITGTKTLDWLVRGYCIS